MALHPESLPVAPVPLKHVDTVPIPLLPLYPSEKMSQSSTLAHLYVR
jgi:hypothetical protein